MNLEHRSSPCRCERWSSHPTIRVSPLAFSFLFFSSSETELRNLGGRFNSSTLICIRTTPFQLLQAYFKLCWKLLNFSIRYAIHLCQKDIWRLRSEGNVFLLFSITAPFLLRILAIVTIVGTTGICHSRFWQSAEMASCNAIYEEVLLDYYNWFICFLECPKICTCLISGIEWKLCSLR